MLQKSIIFIAAFMLLITGPANILADDGSPYSSLEVSGTGASPLMLPDQFTAVLSSFIGDETAPVKGSDGLWHVVYELWLTNGKQVPATLEMIEVLNFDDQTEVVHTLEDESLLDALFELSTQPAEDTVLEPNESALVFIELEFESPEDVPDRIVHRLTGTGANNPGSREPVPINYLFSPWDISNRSAPIIGPPLAGGGWLVINGCCAGRNAHRGSVQTVNGTLLDSQRFAIDWMRLNKKKQLAKNDSSVVSNWIGYNSPIFAIADGTVVETLDGLPDQVPGELPDPLTITLQTVDGNHIILDLGNGVYAFYAHLKNGSVLVEPGDSVKAGQKIARLGNSGNTSAPHLHLQLMTSPSAIASDGIPYVFNRFKVQGAIDEQDWDDAEDIEGPWTIIDVDERGCRINELPMNLRVVKFPKPNQRKWRCRDQSKKDRHDDDSDDSHDDDD